MVDNVTTSVGNVLLLPNCSVDNDNACWIPTVNTTPWLNAGHVLLVIRWQSIYRVSFREGRGGGGGGCPPNGTGYPPLGK